MPATLKQSEFEFDVIGEEALHGHHNPKGVLFIPVWAKVVVWGDQVDIWVRGPELNKAGKQLKRHAVTSYDLDDINDKSAPAWVLDLVAQVRS